MKLIIAGSRHMQDKDAWLIPAAMRRFALKPTEVVCGMAKGADTLGMLWAEDRGITVAKFPADWDKYGKAAGPIRNKQMADYGDALLAFLWDGSRGTLNMINTMKRFRKLVHVVNNGAIE